MSEADETKPREMKVTDRRMFTPEGELREEYRELVEAARGAAAKAASQPQEAEPRQAGAQRTEPQRTDPRQAERQPPPSAAGGPDQGYPDQGYADQGAPFEIPGAPPGLGPAFLDLVAVLAEPVPLYLGDAPLPDGRSAENMEAARFHIDLLDVLRQKTAGNLNAQESAVLEDVLYRLRMRFVQKRG